MHPPYDHPLNLMMQATLTYASWGITLILLAIAIKRDLREHTAFNSLVILAGLVGAFAEPLYDVGHMLWFYTPGQWTTFTAFAIPQPVWTHSGYVVLYSGPAMYICAQIRQGLSRNGLYKWAGATLLMSMAFEIIGINGGTYTYWGPHAFRILDYPLAIGVLEAAQVICFSVMAAELRRKSQSTLPLLGLFPLFLCTFYMSNFGAGAPLIIALHIEPPSTTLIAAASLLSIGFAGLLVRAAASLLPASDEQRPATIESTLRTAHS